jgi:hypothetical protein
LQRLRAFVKKIFQGYKMVTIQISEATHAKLVELGGKMQLASTAEQEADQILQELIDRLQRFQELPAKVAQLKADADAAASGVAKAVAADLTNPPA